MAEIPYNPAWGLTPQQQTLYNQALQQAPSNNVNLNSRDNPEAFTVSPELLATRSAMMSGQISGKDQAETTAFVENYRRGSAPPTPPPDPLLSLSPEQRAEFSKQFSIGLSKGQLSDQASVDAFKSSFAKQALGGSIPSIYTNQPSVFGAPAGTSATQQNNVAGVAGGGLRSRYGTQDELDAESYLGSFKAPETEEQIQARKLKENQSRIDSINNYYQELVYGQQRVNEQSDREANAQAVLSGLQGSTEAGGMMRESQQRGQREIGKIQAEKTMQIQQLYADIQRDAYTAYRDQLSDARQSAGDVLAMRDAREQKASSQAQLLAQSGIDMEKLAQQDPKTYQYLEQSVGGPEILKALFTLNRPKESIIDKKIEGGKYIIAYQKPDGSVRIESVDLGLPNGYNKTIDAGDRIIAVPDNWDGDTSKLVTINKGIAPKAGGTTPSGTGGAYGSDLEAVIGNTLASIPTKFGQEAFQQQVARARNDSDRINLVATQVLKGQPAEFKRDFTNQAVGIAQLDKAIKLIDSGVKTGVLENAAQYTFNLAGKDFDPKIAEINNYLVSAIQPYRNSVTGAAWGAQEDGEYQQLFGSTKYAPTELRQRLVQVKELLKSKSVNGLNAFVNPLGTNQNVFETGNFAPGGTDVNQEILNAGGRNNGDGTFTMPDGQIVTPD